MLIFPLVFQILFTISLIMNLLKGLEERILPMSTFSIMIASSYASSSKASLINDLSMPVDLTTLFIMVST